MELRYNFRIYPTEDQANHFLQEIGNQRFVWNHFLDREIKHHNETQKFRFYHDNSIHLSKSTKKEFEFLKVGDSTALQQTLRSLETAMKRCFKKIGGFPKFKKKKDFDGSYTLVRSKGLEFNKKQIKIPKIGWVNWVCHRHIPSIPKTAIIIQDGKQWFISLVLHIEEKCPVDIKSFVGIDLNSHGYVTSDGQEFLNPKFFKKSKNLIKRRNRQLAKTRKGSNRRKIARLKLRSAYRKIKNQRKDFVHKISNQITNDYDLIAMENLNVKGMQKFNGRMINDNCFAALKGAIAYKCKLKGKHFVEIGRFDPSSKACNACGWIDDTLTLADRIFTCQYCGHSEDRDLNAAMNIRDWGLKTYTDGTSGNYGRGDTSIGVSDFSGTRYVSLNRQKFLFKQEAIIPSGW